MKILKYTICLSLVFNGLWSQNLPKVVKVTTLTSPIEAGSGGMEVDIEGTIYMSNFGEILNQAGGKEVFKITPEGQVSIFAKGLNGASGSDIGPNGLFYQSNVSGNKISVIDQEGNVQDYALKDLYSPVGLVKTERSLFVANCGSGTIQKISSEGASTVFAKSDLLKCPNGLVMDEADNLYAANFYDGNVVKIDKKGNASLLATLPGGNNGHLVYHKGVFYVIARKGNQIWAVDLEGNKTLLAGSGAKGNDDGAPMESTFRYPNDLAFSPDFSKLYINDVVGDSDNGFVLGPVVIRVLHLEW